MAIIPNAQTIKQCYIDSCNAVIERGGSVPSGMGILGLADKITNIPHDASLGYHEANSNSYISQVPSRAEGYAMIKRVGGMNYRCKNLIPFPYVDISKTEKGITFTVNDDNSITVSGTATGDGYFTLLNLSEGSPQPIPVNGTYYLSGVTGGGDLYYLQTFREGILSDEPCRKRATRLEYSNDKIVLIRFYYKTGAVINETIYPMLNEGETALPYEPFFGGFRTIAVRDLESNGANLIPFPYAEGAGKTMYGITFTVNDDRSISVKGTATQNATFYFVRHLQVSAGNYYISGEGDIRGYKTDVNNNPVYFNKGAQIFDQPYNISSYIVVLGGDTVDYTAYPMMNRGTTAQPYKPYVGTIDTLAIPGAVQILDGYGEGIDDTYYNYIDFERKVFVQRVKTLLLEGTETWVVATTVSSNAKRMRLTLADKPYFKGVTAVSNLICNHYETGTAENTYDLKRTIANDANYIFIYDEDYQDYPSWKAHLKELYDAGNPLVVTYALAEPIVTDISEYLTDEFIKVEGGGTIAAINSEEKDVPIAINYLIDTIGG